MYINIYVHSSTEENNILPQQNAHGKHFSGCQMAKNEKRKKINKRKKKNPQHHFFI